MSSRFALEVSRTGCHASSGGLKHAPCSGYSFLQSVLKSLVLSAVLNVFGNRRTNDFGDWLIVDPRYSV